MRIIPFLFGFLLLLACSQNKSSDTDFIGKDYQLNIPKNQNSLLVLFPCYPCDAENTKLEFDVVEMALKNDIAVLLMNFNKHLWMLDEEKESMEKLLLHIIDKHDLKTDNTIVGGFSGGGNVSLIMTEYLKKKNSSIQPKGVFIVDSPIDLQGLYENAKKTMKKNYSKVAMDEAQWIINTFDAQFGIGNSGKTNQERYSPYSLSTRNLENLSHLHDVRVRLYTEPDTTWWLENRQTAYEEMNAHYISHLSNDLQEKYKEDNIELILTENKGYRNNGARHPHSWAIVDKKELIDWVAKP